MPKVSAYTQRYSYWEQKTKYKSKQSVEERIRPTIFSSFSKGRKQHGKQETESTCKNHVSQHSRIPKSFLIYSISSICSDRVIHGTSLFGGIMHTQLECLFSSMFGHTSRTRGSFRSSNSTIVCLGYNTPPILVGYFSLDCFISMIFPQSIFCALTLYHYLCFCSYMSATAYRNYHKQVSNLIVNYFPNYRPHDLTLKEPFVPSILLYYK